MKKVSENKIEDRIVAEARILFMERGFEQASMSEIALRMGISRPKLHYYFHTKDQLFQSVLAEIVSRLIPHLQEILGSEKPVFDRIEQIADVYIKMFREYPQLPRFIVNEVDRDLPHLLSTVHSLGIDAVLVDVLGMVHREVERGAIRDVPLPIIFLTFYSQLTFPFLSGKLVSQVMFGDNVLPDSFYSEWKKNIVCQMKALLLVS